MFLTCFVVCRAFVVCAIVAAATVDVHVLDPRRGVLLLLHRLFGHLRRSATTKLQLAFVVRCGIALLIVDDHFFILFNQINLFMKKN